jgi:hypothetical protein
MSIKPVDYQMIIPKSAELSRISNDEQNKNHIIQHQQGNAVQNKAENALKQVYSQDKTQEARVREKQQKQQKQQKRPKDDSNKKSKGSNEKKSNGAKVGFIDIRI